MQNFTKGPYFKFAVFFALLTTLWGVNRAQAQEVAPTQVSDGFAVLHIDSQTATLATLCTTASCKAGESLAYSMKIPKDSRGQWMGERTTSTSAGTDVTRIRVGDLTAEKLVSAWRRFRYPYRGNVRATLTWVDRSGNTKAAAVHLTGRPGRTKRRVNFKLTSRKTLPRSLKNMSLHLVRADYSPTRTGKSALMTESSKSTVSAMTTITKFPSTQITTIVDTLTLSQYNATSNQVKVSLYDADASAPSCWTADSDNVSSMSGNQRYWRVDPITCAGVTTMNADGSPDGEPWGTLLDVNESDNTAQVTLSLVVTPPGAYPYTYTHQFDPWSF